MIPPLFNRDVLNFKPLRERRSKTDISKMVVPDSRPAKISKEQQKTLEHIAQEFKKRKPIILAYGAHLVKNGCSPLIIRLIEQGYVQQLLTNGAGIIHDFEFAFQGETEEDVEQGLKEGQFGLWDETGKLINQCINEGAKKDKGIGKSLGVMISKEFNPEHSIPARASELGIPLSVCVAIGQDCIHTHPECDGASLGKASYIDFLKFARTVQELQGGMYISIGSAIMSPMVFEKALSMARNTTKPENFHIVVNDIQPDSWDWSQGEPPKDHPNYFLRFNKTFSRAAKACNSRLTYVQMDNRAFIHNLYHLLK